MFPLTHCIIINLGIAGAVASVKALEEYPLELESADARGFLVKPPVIYGVDLYSHDSSGVGIVDPAESARREISSEKPVNTKAKDSNPVKSSQNQGENSSQKN